MKSYSLFSIGSYDDLLPYGHLSQSWIVSNENFINVTVQHFKEDGSVFSNATTFKNKAYNFLSQCSQASIKCYNASERNNGIP